MHDGDELVVTSMGRLAHSLRDLVDIVDEITTKGVTLTFLTEGQRPTAPDAKTPQATPYSACWAPLCSSRGH